jgi:hypothetical protein
VIGKERVTLVHVDGRAGEGAQFMRAADVIDMGMGDHNHLHLELMAIQNGDDFLYVITRVDNDRFPAHGISQYRTVAAKHADGQNFMN